MASNRDMVTVPASEFFYGASDEEVLMNGLHDELADAKPRRLIFLPEFKIDRFPITNEQFAKYIRDRQAEDSSFSVRLPYGWVGEEGEWNYPSPRFPVVGLTWHECNEYAKFYGLRLPTELEWEKAARGVDGRRFPWGEDANIHLYANFLASDAHQSEGGLVDVDGFPRGVSPFGCWDMVGNAEEWCSNGYALRSWSQAIDEDTGDRTWKVIRGCFYGWKHVHVAKRFHSKADQPWAFVGFRCCL